jgi:hypothetical protein
VTQNNLFPLPEAANLLGGISIWTLRKHIARGNVAVTHLGRRVFLRSEEVERIRGEGLPPLATGNVGSGLNEQGQHPKEAE